MSKIIIQFSTPFEFNPFSWAIRKIDGVPYSHSSIRYKNVEDRDKVLEANRHGVIDSYFTTWACDNVILKKYEISGPDETIGTAMRKAMKHIGKTYGFFTVVGFLFERILKKIGLGGLPFRDGTKTEFCSELVAYILKEIDPSISTELKDYETLTPSEVDNLLLKASKREFQSGIKVTLL